MIRWHRYSLGDAHLASQIQIFVLCSDPILAKCHRGCRKSDFWMQRANPYRSYTLRSTASELSKCVFKNQTGLAGGKGGRGSSKVLTLWDHP
eukprot:1160420-Pelagomonas_calceolata.AAC.12